MSFAFILPLLQISLAHDTIACTNDDSPSNDIVYIIVISILVVILLGVLIDDVLLRKRLRSFYSSSLQNGAIHPHNSFERKDISGEYVTQQHLRNDTQITFTGEYVESDFSRPNRVDSAESNWTISQAVDIEETDNRDLDAKRAPENAKVEEEPTSQLKQVSDEIYIEEGDFLPEMDADFELQPSFEARSSLGSEYVKIRRKSMDEPKCNGKSKKKKLLNLSRLEIKEGEIKVYRDDVVGSGRFGTVHKGFYRGVMVAVKQLPSSKDLNEEVKTFFDASLHPNICRIMGIYRHDETRACIVMELYPDGNLKSYLQNLPAESTKLSLKGYFMGITAGLRHLHAEGIVHGDLALRNMLVNIEQNRVAISDFGLAKCQHNPKKQKSIAARWASPELINTQVATKASDVWATGIVYLELNNRGELPYAELTVNEVIRRLQIKAKPRVNDEFPKKVKEMLQGIFLAEHERWDAKKVNLYYSKYTFDYARDHDIYCPSLRMMEESLFSDDPNAEFKWFW